MRLHTLKPREGSTHRSNRFGRGTGSGHGKTSGRGHKGQGSRSGSSTRPGFEGGQMPLARRLPKRGFSNAQFCTEYLPVNLDSLEQHFAAGATVDVAAMRKAGLANGRSDGIKILGVGKLTKKLTVVAHRFSKTAREAIEKVGGVCEQVVRPKAAPRVASKK
ncbi:MAG: 50S ribosomal protein L15 [Pedosphaera sp.]|nr:50S ribosomal protein L15 [Pedosphaera sp.]MSU42775.1 50S ribosomal protein L15 [Pedosphaera sp.]